MAHLRQGIRFRYAKNKNAKYKARTTRYFYRKKTKNSETKYSYKKKVIASKNKKFCYRA